MYLRINFAQEAKGPETEEERDRRLRHNASVARSRDKKKAGKAAAKVAEAAAKAATEEDQREEDQCRGVVRSQNKRRKTVPTSSTSSIEGRSASPLAYPPTGVEPLLLHTPEAPGPDGVDPEMRYSTPPTVPPQDPEADVSGATAPASPSPVSPLYIFPENPASVSPNAPEITWPNGVTTKLPWIDGTVEQPNLLELDEGYVRCLAASAKCATECPVIEYIDAADYPDASTFTAYIHEMQRQGRFVVARNFDSHRVSLNAHELHAELRINLEARASVHSALRRATNPAELRAFETHATFLANVADPSRVETILHCPDPSNYVPRRIALLDEGTHAVNTVSKEDYHRAVASDLARARSWHLLHGPLYMTYPHHDAGGLGTWTIVRSGYKLWVAVIPKGEYFNSKSMTCHKRYLKPFTTHEAGKEYWTSDVPTTCDRYAIVAGPGTLLVQPPHFVHEVYTPNESVTSGGHFVTYDSLHLTALGRLFDKKTGGIATNAEHDYHFETFVHMVRYIPLNPDRAYRRKALAALCALVLFPADYCEKVSPEKWAPSVKLYQRWLKKIPRDDWSKELYTYSQQGYPLEEHQVALQIISVLVDSLALKIDRHGKFLFEGERWTDPGEEVYVGEYVRLLKSS